jgi:N-acetyl-anhydromuramyl-L-alanine amidase AmpD
MKASSIPDHELSFQTNAVDSAGKKFVLTDETVSIPGTAETITFVDCKRDNGDKSFYYEEATAKKKIVLHYTMGYIKGDIEYLTKQHVSVPFLIARSGSIYNLFASKYWSYHLGPGASGGNTAMSRECIGIEISNIGPLKKIGDKLVTSYGDNDVYCAAGDTQYYAELATAYRGFKYYAKFTDGQYGSLTSLLKFLCAKYNIPKTFVTEQTRYSVMSNQEFKNFAGIVSHVNCRSDKTDIGPAFDWARLISGV